MSDLGQSTPRASSSPARAPVGSIVLLVFAAFLYLVMMVNLSESVGGDAAGRGMAMAFAALVGVVLWIVLAVLLVIAAVKGRMPVAAAVAAFVLWPLAAVAAFVAIDMYDTRHRWAIFVPALLPPLVALYALWARLPSLHTRIPALATSLFVGIAVVGLSVAPLASVLIKEPRDPEREAKMMVEAKARQDREEAEAAERQKQEDAKFAALNSDSSLGDYLPYLSGPHSRQALDGLRQAKSRQSDAIALLQQGRLPGLSGLSGFNLEPTAELCQAFGAALGSAAGGVNKSVRSDYLTAAIDLEWQLPNIEWLVRAHCDLSQPLGLLETNVRAVADSARMTKFADRLAELRKPR